NYAYAITGPDESGNGNNNKPVENTPLLKYISPLNLVDPLLDNFTPEACRTIHDILRFIHAKSAAELAAAGQRQ
ncbi:MAG: hypothetical protein OEU95_04550, partial [Nitrospirota bacterium]|nr:hypothetical protein [Nitrospirota bacterium]